MSYKISLVVELDENGFYAWCPELPGCQTQADTLDEVMKNIQEATEFLFWLLRSFLQKLLLRYCAKTSGT